MQKERDIYDLIFDVENVTLTIELQIFLTGCCV